MVLLVCVGIALSTFYFIYFFILFPTGRVEVGGEVCVGWVMVMFILWVVCAFLFVCLYVCLAFVIFSVPHLPPPPPPLCDAFVTNTLISLSYPSNQKQITFSGLCQKTVPHLFNNDLD